MQYKVSLYFNQECGKAIEASVYLSITSKGHSVSQQGNKKSEAPVSHFNNLTWKVDIWQSRKHIAKGFDLWPPLMVRRVL